MTLTNLPHSRIRIESGRIAVSAVPVKGNRLNRVGLPGQGSSLIEFLGSPCPSVRFDFDGQAAGRVEGSD
jgi:hypothetical protein